MKETERERKGARSSERSGDRAGIADEAKAKAKAKAKATPSQCPFGQRTRLEGRHLALLAASGNLNALRYKSFLFVLLFSQAECALLFSARPGRSLMLRARAAWRDSDSHACVIRVQNLSQQMHINDAFKAAQRATNI